MRRLIIGVVIVLLSSAACQHRIPHGAIRQVTQAVITALPLSAPSEQSVY